MRADTFTVQTEAPSGVAPYLAGSATRVDRPPMRANEPTEFERMEAELLACAHREAMRWGADQFAAEFRRRDEEERRLREAEARAFGNGIDADREQAPDSFVWGPVLAEVADRVVGPEGPELELRRPMKHPFVPRPSMPEPEAPRSRRRRRNRTSPDPKSMISASEAARMSPAARRLYGLPDLPDRRRAARLASDTRFGSR